MTFEEMKNLPEEDQGKLFKRLKSIRNNFKPANYAGIYGVGAPTLSRQTGMPQAKCKSLLTAYWARNWAVKTVSSEQTIKTLKDGSMWLQNPVSGFWHSLRYEKDIFSTLNQSTGVFVFDQWLYHMRKAGIVNQLSYHDEVLFTTPVDTTERVKETLDESMKKVNETLKLNVEIEVDVQFGGNYAEVH